MFTYLIISLVLLGLVFIGFVVSYIRAIYLSFESDKRRDKAFSDLSDKEYVKVLNEEEKKRFYSKISKKKIQKRFWNKNTKTNKVDI